MDLILLQQFWPCCTLEMGRHCNAMLVSIAHHHPTYIGTAKFFNKKIQMHGNKVINLIHHLLYKRLSFHPGQHRHCKILHPQNSKAWKQSNQSHPPSSFWLTSQGGCHFTLGERGGVTHENRITYMDSCPATDPAT